jgi:hypothetical protein
VPQPGVLVERPKQRPVVAFGQRADRVGRVTDQGLEEHSEHGSLGEKSSALRILDRGLAPLAQFGGVAPGLVADLSERVVERLAGDG